MLTPILLTLCGLAGSEAGHAVEPEIEPAPAPRVLVVDLDDFGLEVTGLTSTPLFDLLDARARRFDNFYTAPLCTPSRAMMHIGAHGSHPDLLCGHIMNPDDGYELPVAPLEPLGRVVSNAGFRTAKIGKWHLSYPHSLDHPQNHGWRHYRGQMGNHAGSTLAFFVFPKVVDGVLDPEHRAYLTSDETDDALEFVLRGYELVSLSYHAIHRPYHVPPAHLHSVPGPLTNMTDLARADVQALDHELTRLLRAALERDYTILVFGDNGSSSAIGGRKGALYQGGIHCPLWALGAGVQPGVDASLVSVVDVYATVLELFAIPTGPTRGPHSISFAPQLAGAAGARTWVYSERFRVNGVDPRPFTERWRRAVTDGRFKLLRNEEVPGDRLFDLWSDPSESDDLLDDPTLDPAASAALSRFYPVLDRLAE